MVHHNSFLKIRKRLPFFEQKKKIAGRSGVKRQKTTERQTYLLAANHVAGQSALHLSVTYVLTL